MQGYIYISDYFYYWGINSTQMPTTTTVTPALFQYRNYLMGFNQIHKFQNINIIIYIKIYLNYKILILFGIE